MSNELTVKKDSLVTVIEDKGIGDVLRPLVTEIHLFDTFIAGTSHLKDPAPLRKAKPGDRLTLRREANRFDDKAIVILDPEGGKLGYVPEKDNIIFSRLMDAGKLLIAKINEIRELEFMTKVSISIYLVDY